MVLGNVDLVELILAILGDDVARKFKNRHKPNDQLFSEYLDVIFNSYSPPYFKEAKRVLGQYQAFLSEAAPSAENFARFFTRYRDLKANSRARYYSAFSAFFKWYSGEKLPFSVKTPKIAPQSVSDEEVTALKQAISDKRSHANEIERDLLIIDMMCMAGLRRGEVAGLLLSHLDLGDDPKVTVKGGKGEKDRIVPLPRSLAVRLKAYAPGKASNSPVFAMQAKSISNKINIWAKKAGVPQLHPHSFRHKFATDLLHKGSTCVRCRNSLVMRALRSPSAIPPSLVPISGGLSTSSMKK